MLSDKMLVTSYTLTNSRRGTIIALVRQNGEKWTLYNVSGQPVCDLSQEQFDLIGLVDGLTLDEPLPWDDSDLETRGCKLGIPTV